MNPYKEMLTKQIVDLPALESKVIHVKRDIEELDTLVQCGVIRCGESHSDDYESGCQWWTFDAKRMNDEQIRDSLIKLEIVEDTDRGVYDDNDWDCSGKCMRNEPRIKRTNTRVLVTQSWCYDF